MTHNSSPWVPRLRWAAITLLFAAGAVAITWPLAAQLDAGIPLGTESVATVPLFNLWTLAWNVESLSHGYRSYWQAPIFHPAADTFALSEPQPLVGVVAAAIHRLGGSVLQAYNLILITTLALNGLLATLLLRRVGLAWLPALGGGALVLVLPFTHQELGVLQLVPLAGVLLFALAVVRFAEAPSRRGGLALGGSLALAYGLSSQVTVFAALAAIPAILWLWWPHRREREAWIGVTAGAALFLILSSPLIAAQVRATADAGFTRSAETVRKQSAQLDHYLKSPWQQIVPTPGVATAERPSRRAFWPGTLRVLLALAALALAWRSERWRRMAVTGGLLLAASLLLSFGANLAIAGFSLADALRTLPGLAQIRSYFRFALFSQLAVAALAAGALQLLLEQVKRRTTNLRASLVVASVALLAVVEMRPVMGEIEPLPPLDLELPWLDWIERETASDDPLAFVPFPRERSARAYLGTSQWMYWQLRHWRPMVNGYSGFFPASFRELKKTMETFPSTPSLLALRDAGVRYAIVHRRVIEQSPPPDPEGPVRLVQRFRDEQHALAIFELQSNPLQ